MAGECQDRCSERRVAERVRPLRSERIGVGNSPPQMYPMDPPRFPYPWFWMYGETRLMALMDASKCQRTAFLMIDERSVQSNSEAHERRERQSRLAHARRAHLGGRDPGEGRPDESEH